MLSLRDRCFPKDYCLHTWDQTHTQTHMNASKSLSNPLTMHAAATLQCPNTEINVRAAALIVAELELALEK